MADYRELLRRAVDALPENTGTHRRAVYEKARSALVAQLRAIEPPLPAREITTHRLNLEDCIREVEQEATEALLGRIRNTVSQPVVQPQTPVLVDNNVAEEPDFSDTFAEAVEENYIAENLADAIPVGNNAADVNNDAARSAAVFIAEPEVQAPQVDANDAFTTDASPYEMEIEVATEDAGEELANALEVGFYTQSESIADSFTAGVNDFSAQAEDFDVLEHDENLSSEDTNNSIEDIIAQASRNVDAEVAVDSPLLPNDETGEHAQELHIDPEPLKAAGKVAVEFFEPKLNETSEDALVAVEPNISFSSDNGVKTGELGFAFNGGPEIDEAQVSIDRAIAALDKEAKHGEGGFIAASNENQSDAENDDDDTNVARKRGPSALTIFLIIAVVLLGGGAAGGFWAWREGYIDFNQIFAQTETTPTPQTTADGTPTNVTPPVSPEVPGNTTAEAPPSGVAGETMPGEELPFVETETPNTAPTEPAATFDDRLPSEETVEQTEPPMTENVIAEAANAAQSLLLEEQANGASGAVPYSGNVEWTRSTDELGHPTIIGTAAIPARNLEVKVLLRRNNDANLPASHLMEVNFTVAETFVGGSIANLPGVLLKDAELVQGSPLTGASARIVGNSFLFALSSASERDVEANERLLSERGWIDLAMVYGTGRRAILTLEKGEAGMELFNEVFDAWNEIDADPAP